MKMLNKTLMWSNYIFLMTIKMKKWSILLLLIYRDNDSDNHWKIKLNIDDLEEEYPEPAKSEGSNKICINFNDLQSDEDNNKIVIEAGGNFL